MPIRVQIRLPIPTARLAGLPSRPRAAEADRPLWQRLPSACLLYWHLCSLDAPTVAIVWAAALMRLAALPAGAASTRILSVLGLGTWIVYVLDRLLDTACIDPSQIGPAQAQPGAASQPGPRAGVDLPGIALQDRHYFHRRHRRRLLGLCASAAVLSGLLCLRLPLRLVESYALLSLPVAAYALSVHRRLLRPASAAAPSTGTDLEPVMRFRARTYRTGSAKEAAVGLLFTAAVAAPALSGAAPGRRQIVLLAALLLALVCWLNCRLITHAEAHLSRFARRQQQRRIAICAVMLALAAAAACILGRASALATPSSALTTVAAALLLSCLLLLSLLYSRGEPPSNPRRIRVLADLALLTPLLFLFTQR